MIPKYSEIEKRVRTVEYPIKNCVVYAYKEGESEKFGTLEDARKYSKNTEVVYVNKAEYDSQLEQYNRESVLVMQAFMDKIYGYYSGVPKDIVDSMWGFSYDDNHSYGYDEVFIGMDKYYDFYLDVKKCLTPQ